MSAACEMCRTRERSVDDRLARGDAHRHRPALVAATVAVLGCGQIGLLTMAVARASGCLNLLAVDRSPFRLALAERLGAHGVVTADGSEDVAAALRARNAGDGMDVVFEMAGAARSVKDAFVAVRHGGHVVLFGLPARPVELDIAEDLIFKNVEVTAASGREIFATWYQAARLRGPAWSILEPLVTHRAMLDGFGEAIELLQLGAAGKIVLDPQAPLGSGVVATDAMRTSSGTPAPALV